MRKNVQKVMEAFDVGRASGGTTVYTDGNTVFSYDMPIAQRIDGRIEVITDGPTMTTKQHIGAVRSYLAFARAPHATVENLTGRAPHVFRRRAGNR